MAELQNLTLEPDEDYRIIIADDHQMFRDGLKNMIHSKSKMNVVAEASDGKELLSILEKINCDIILLDLSMPNLNGIEALEIIKNKYPKIKILILTMYHENTYFKHAIEKGADGFMLKTEMFTSLISAIRQITSGDIYFKNLTDKKEIPPVLQEKLKPLKIEIENEIEEAISNNEFIIFYQPVFSMNDGKISSLEALVRWQKPNGEILSPDYFLAAAEKSGQIRKIGKFVLINAVKQLKQWRDIGYTNISVSVNFSAIQFECGQIIDDVKEVLEESGIPPDKLRVEVTESLAMKDVALAKNIFLKLRDLGVTILMDDFGIGHSSLKYIQEFPVHGLKIDKSFIDSIENNNVNKLLTQSIITMAKHLKLKTVVEGVENQKQLETLRELNCEEVQGFYFSKPLTDKETIIRLAEE